MIKHDATNTYRTKGLKLNAFLTSALNLGVLSPPQFNNPRREVSHSVGVQKYWAIKFYKVRPNIFVTIIAVIFSHTRICVTSSAPSEMLLITVRFRGHVTLLGPRNSRLFLDL